MFIFKADKSILFQSLQPQLCYQWPVSFPLKVGCDWLIGLFNAAHIWKKLPSWNVSLCLCSLRTSVFLWLLPCAAQKHPWNFDGRLFTDAGCEYPACAVMDGWLPACCTLTSRINSKLTAELIIVLWFQKYFFWPTRSSEAKLQNTERQIALYHPNRPLCSENSAILVVTWAFKISMGGWALNSQESMLWKQPPVQVQGDASLYFESNWICWLTARRFWVPISGVPGTWMWSLHCLDISYTGMSVVFQWHSPPHLQVPSPLFPWSLVPQI